MNSVVAIGGAPLLQVVSAYRGLVPSVVWVLGLKTPRDPKDQLVRSLESLVEPLMEPYFAAEARLRVAGMSSQLASQLLPARSVDDKREVNAVSESLSNEFASVLALVAMLDCAHAIHPVELVVDDDSSPFARAAVAWARARGLPSVTLPASRPWRAQRRSRGDRTIVIGDRARQAYGALDIGEPRLIHITTGDSSFEPDIPERIARRDAAKAALARALGWTQSETVIVFARGVNVRESALEPDILSAEPFIAMLRAFVVARANQPNLRLTIIASPPTNAQTLVAQAAARAGLAPGDFAFTESDYNLWLAAADIVVSSESACLIDAAFSGVPAVMLWGSAEWYLGPAFAAEDGVINVAPENLGGTLVALASDESLRSQISAIAGGRLASQSTSNPRLVAEIAATLATCRRPEKVFAKRSRPKPDIVIYAPEYSHASAGIRALYRLCHLINMAGGNASMYPPTQVHPQWNTPRRDTNLTDQTIIVYPEIYHVSPAIKRVVRWVLNAPGLLAGPKTYGDNEMVFYFDIAFRAAAQAATADILTAERELKIAVIEPELFFNDRSRERLYDCVFVHKGRPIYDLVQHRDSRDAYVIHDGWPATRAETAALLRGCRRLYSFDVHSAILMEAIICGAQVYYVGAGYEWFEQHNDLSDYVRQYYSLSHVQRFLRLIDERWN